MSSAKFKDETYKGVYYRVKQNGEVVYYVKFKHDNKTIERTVDATTAFGASKERNRLIYESKNPDAVNNPYKASTATTLEYVFNRYCDWNVPHIIDSCKFSKNLLI